MACNWDWHGLDISAHTQSGVHFCIWKDGMTKLNPAKFVREVRQEAHKVHWPTRKETMVSTGLILVLVFISALFFLLVDNLAAAGVSYLLDIGR